MPDLKQNDRKELIFQCRMGFTLGSLLFLLLVLGMFALVLTHVISYQDSVFSYGLIAAFVIGCLVVVLMNRKYYQDLRSGMKRIEIKRIDKKEAVSDWEAGSGKIGRYAAIEMKEFTRYSFIIENVRYRVEKELFDSCNEGDEVQFHLAKESGYRLAITRKDVSSYSKY